MISDDVSPPAKDVSTPSREYKEHAQRWILPRALMGGTVAMRDGATKHGFLPQEPGESDVSFAVRLVRTTLFNAYRKTVKDMTGKVFAEAIAVGDDVPAKIRGYCENIDLTGRNLDCFAYDVFHDALEAPGVSFILAEMPQQMAEGATRADELAAGRRPYLVHVKAEDIIGWKSALVNGRQVLTQIRIRECIEEPDDKSPYEDEEEVQIRVLEPGKWQIWRQREAEGGEQKKDWYLFQEGTTSLDHIPLSVVYLKRDEFMTGEPPLEDLAYLNLCHYQSQSDQRNILHVARVPILFGAGFDETSKLVVGAGTMARSSDPSARLEYVEHSGAAIAAGRDDLKDIELQMQVMGLQLLLPQPTQTATGEIRDDVKENSQLSMMARALQDALEQSLADMAEYDGLGKDAGGSLTVNTDFGIAAGATADLDTLINAARLGRLSVATFLKELQRRGVLDESVIIDEEVAAIEAQKQRDAAMAEEIAKTATPTAPLVAAAA